MKAQPQLSTLCIHQNDAYTGLLADFASSSLTVFSHRDNQIDPDYAQLRQFAEKATNVTTWGGNWSLILLRGNRIPPDFERNATCLTVCSFCISTVGHRLTHIAQESLGPMEDLDAIALFTSDQSSSYDCRQAIILQIALEKLLCNFAEAGLNIKWVLIIHRDIRYRDQRWRPNKGVISFEGIHHNGDMKGRRVSELPNDVKVISEQLGTAGIVTHEAHEEAALGASFISQARVTTHVKTWRYRRALGEAEEKEIKSRRAVVAQREQKKAVALEAESTRAKRQRPQSGAENSHGNDNSVKKLTRLKRKGPRNGDGMESEM